jgi:hypothetical protein
MSRPWEPAKKEAARVLRAAGWNSAAIAHLVGIPQQTAAKVFLQPPTRPKRSKARLHGLVRRLQDAMWTRAMIAGYVGISTSRVDRILAGRARSLKRNPHRPTRLTVTSSSCDRQCDPTPGDIDVRDVVGISDLVDVFGRELGRRLASMCALSEDVQ